MSPPRGRGIIISAIAIRVTVTCAVLLRDMLRTVKYWNRDLDLLVMPRPGGAKRRCCLTSLSVWRLTSSVAGLGGGISWRPPAYSLFTIQFSWSSCDDYGPFIDEQFQFGLFPVQIVETYTVIRLCQCYLELSVRCFWGRPESLVSFRFQFNDFWGTRSVSCHYTTS